MMSFKCAKCGEVSELSAETWFDDSVAMTLEDDDSRVMCEHCSAVYPSRLHLEPFWRPDGGAMRLWLKPGDRVRTPYGEIAVKQSCKGKLRVEFPWPVSVEHCRGSAKDLDRESD